MELPRGQHKGRTRRTGRKQRFPGLFLSLGCLCLTPVNLHAAPYNKSLIEAYDALRDHNPGYCLSRSRADNSNGLLSDGDSYILESLVRMYRTTGKRTYLDGAIDLASCIVARRGWLHGRFEDDERFRDVWPNQAGHAFVAPRATAYGTGLIVRALADVALAIAENPEVAADPAYSNIGASLLRVGMDAIQVHNVEWRDLAPVSPEEIPGAARREGPSVAARIGAYVFPAGSALPDKDRPKNEDDLYKPLLWYCGVPLPLNQNAAIGRALAATTRLAASRPDWLPQDRRYLDAIQDMRQKVLSLSVFLRRDLIVGDRLVWWKYWSRFYRTRASGSRLYLGSGKVPEERACGPDGVPFIVHNRADDLSHGYLVAAFMLDARNLDRTLFTREELRGIARLLPARMDAGYDIPQDSGAMRDLLSGTSDFPKQHSYNRYRSITGLWLVLANLEPQILPIAFRAHFPDLRALPGLTPFREAVQLDQPGWIHLVVANFAASATGTDRLWLSMPLPLSSKKPITSASFKRVRVARLAAIRSSQTSAPTYQITIAYKRRWRPRRTTIVQMTVSASSSVTSTRVIRQRRYMLQKTGSLVADFDCDGTADLLVDGRRKDGRWTIFPAFGQTDLPGAAFALTGSEPSGRIEFLSASVDTSRGCHSVVTFRKQTQPGTIYSVRIPAEMMRPDTRTTNIVSPVYLQPRPLTVPTCMAAHDEPSTLLLEPDTARPIQIAFSGGASRHKLPGASITDVSCRTFSIGVGRGVCPADADNRSCRHDPAQMVRPVVPASSDVTELLFIDQHTDLGWLRLRIPLTP